MANQILPQDAPCVNEFLHTDKNPLHLTNPLRDTYFAIQYKEQTTGFCYADIKWLAGHLGISLSQAYRRVEQLTALGFVEIVKRPGFRRLIRTLCEENAKEMRNECENNAKTYNNVRARISKSQSLNANDIVMPATHKQDSVQRTPPPARTASEGVYGASVSSGAGRDDSAVRKEGEPCTSKQSGSTGTTLITRQAALSGHPQRMPNGKPSGGLNSVSGGTIEEVQREGGKERFPRPSLSRQESAKYTNSIPQAEVKPQKETSTNADGREAVNEFYTGDRSHSLQSVSGNRGNGTDSPVRGNRHRHETSTRMGEGTRLRCRATHGRDTETPQLETLIAAGVTPAAACNRKEEENDTRRSRESNLQETFRRAHERRSRHGNTTEGQRGVADSTNESSTGRQRTEKMGTEEPIPTFPAINSALDTLTAIGVSLPAALKYSHQYSAEELQRYLEAYKQARARGRAQSVGWLVAALYGQWAVKVLPQSAESIQHRHENARQCLYRARTTQEEVSAEWNGIPPPMGLLRAKLTQGGYANG